MPLVRYALYAQGIDLYITPTHDSGDRTVAADIPDGFPGGGELFPRPDLFQLHVDTTPRKPLEFAR